MSDNDWFELFTCFVIACFVILAIIVVVGALVTFPMFFLAIGLLAGATAMVWTVRNGENDGYPY